VATGASVGAGASVGGGASVATGVAGVAGVQAASKRLAINTSEIIQVIFLISFSFGYFMC
jgi:hypothetical protein